MSLQRLVYRLKAGNINRLKISKEDLGSPQPGQVCIKVKAIGLNFADVFAILGLYSATPKEAFIPGLEFSGEVIGLSGDCGNLRTGDQVIGVTRFGAYTNYLNIDHRLCVPLPEHWTFDDGAAYLVQVLTAYYGLINLGNVKQGDTVLIHSGAGGVGIWANRISKHLGCTTIGTVSSKEKLEVLVEEGFDEQILRKKRTFTHDLKVALKERPLNLIMESIGGSIMEQGFKQLAPMGRLVLFGSAHYGERTDRPNYLKLIPKYLSRPKIDPQSMIEQNKSIMAFNLIYLFQQVELMQDILEHLKTMKLGKPLIGHTYDFEQLKEAIRFFQSGKSVGKIVITNIHSDEG